MLQLGEDVVGHFAAYLCFLSAEFDILHLVLVLSLIMYHGGGRYFEHDLICLHHGLIFLLLFLVERSLLRIGEVLNLQLVYLVLQFCLNSLSPIHLSGFKLGRFNLPIICA